MQMHGQMARVPVTARQKFSEAAYFYNGMLPHRTNPVVFPYYLSAFVSALAAGFSGATTAEVTLVHPPRSKTRAATPAPPIESPKPPAQIRPAWLVPGAVGLGAALVLGIAALTKFLFFKKVGS